jgi:hypothetical protein
LQSKAARKSLEIARALLGPHQGAQVGLDGLVRHLLRMLIGRTQRLGRAVDVLVREHGVERPAQAAGRRHGEEGLERLGRPIVVDVAIGEREAAQACGIAGGEDLRDAAAAVVPDQVHTIDPERIEELAQHDGVGGHRHVLVGADLGIAVGSRSTAMQRRTSDSSASWWRHKWPLSSTPCTNKATGPVPASV